MKLYSNNLVKNYKMVTLFVKKLKRVRCNDNVFKCIQCLEIGEMFLSHA